MPVQADGISVSIHKLNGPRYKEYDNPLFGRPDSFEGSVASRIIAALPGQAFEVRVKLGQNYNPHTSAGVEVAIAIGGVTDHLTWDDNAQNFFIKISKAELPREHRFKFFTTYPRDSAERTQSLQLQMPEPDANATTATSAWLVDEAAFDANPGCITVFVVRGSLTGHAEDEPNITNPPKDVREYLKKNMVNPRVICASEFRRLGGDNGCEYAFEFRNMPMDYSRDGQEADPHFGQDDKWHGNIRKLAVQPTPEDSESEEVVVTHASRGPATKRRRQQTRKALESSKNVQKIMKRRTKTQKSRLGVSRSTTTTPCACDSSSFEPYTSMGDCDQDDEEDLPRRPLAPRTDEKNKVFRTMRALSPPDEATRHQGPPTDRRTSNFPRRAQVVDLTPDHKSDAVEAKVESVLQLEAQHTIKSRIATEDHHPEIKAEPKAKTDEELVIVSHDDVLGPDDEEYYKLQKEAAKIRRNYLLEMAEIAAKDRARRRRQTAGKMH